MLTMEGLRLPYSMSTDTSFKIQIGTKGQTFFKAKVRGMISKMPAFSFFTAYQGA
jgi:hypothetical protein